MSLLIPGTNSIKDTGYDVANSLRFDDGSSDYLSISGITPTNSKKFTYSFWVKRTTLNADQAMLSYESDSNNRGGIELQTGELFRYFERVSGSTVIFVEISSLFTDPSAWYNIIVATDTTQSTESDRVKIYVNGVLQTSFATSVTYPSLNSDTRANGSTAKNIGRRNVNNDYFFDGYLAEVVFIDGSQLDQTSFGEFDSDSPRIWKPKDVSGLTFGNAGFYLDFENSSSLGADVSGNSNNFTVNNLTSVDQSTDTCTNNFATLNPLFKTQDSGTLTQGNTIYTAAANAWGGSGSTIALSSGKWYWEGQINDNPGGHFFGVIDDSINVDNSSSAPYQQAGATMYYSGSGGQMYKDGSSDGGSHGTFGASDIISFALNLDDNQISVYKNGSAIVTNFALSTTKNSLFVWVIGYNSGTDQLKVNFGGSPPFTISSGNADANGYGNFEYSVPSGYYSICTKNLAEFG